MDGKMTTKQVCINGLFIALVCLSTMVLQVPVPATSGYIHLGDSVILIVSVFFGWKYGMIAGGVGSQLKVKYGSSVYVASSDKVEIDEIHSAKQYNYAKTVE